MESFRPADRGEALAAKAAPPTAVVTVEGPAAHTGQRVAHGGRDTGTVVGERDSDSDAADRPPPSGRSSTAAPSSAAAARREHQGLQEGVV